MPKKPAKPNASSKSEIEKSIKRIDDLMIREIAEFDMSLIADQYNNPELEKLERKIKRAIDWRLYS